MYKMTDQPKYSYVWKQFLDGKLKMLSEYDRALSHAKTQPVKTHHGNVAEASFRDWLKTFLPKRFGVTSGYIRSQHSFYIPQSGHFDVIIYDQLESPILWIEDNTDKSDNGLVRIIPVEYVRAIIEVKAAFNRSSIKDAIQKIHTLDHLMQGVNDDGELCPGYLPKSVILAIVCFELRKGVRNGPKILEEIRNLSINRSFYGAMILRGEDKNPHDTALIQLTRGEKPHEAIITKKGLLNGLTQTKTIDVGGQHKSALMIWEDINFSKFAFELLASIKRYQTPRSIPNYYGYDFSKLKEQA
jgi:hypothetical protein